MKRAFFYFPLLLCLFLLGGCGGVEEVSKRDNIPFQEGQLYAAAYLGYQQIDDLDYYLERYLDDGELPVHYLSGGDFYLVIPRYDGMALALSRSDIETLQSTLIYEDPDCRPFLLQCNASDIFAEIEQEIH